MPLYELFCLTKHGLGKRQLADIIKLAGRTVIDKGGVITDVKSFGEQPLAYEIRKPGERHSLAAMWQLTFASNAQALNEIDHSLRVDERVLRWVVLKRRPYGPLPSSFRVARTAEKVAESLQASGSSSNQPL